MTVCVCAGNKIWEAGYHGDHQAVLFWHTLHPHISVDYIPEHQDFPYTGLCWCCKDGHVTCARYLLEHGANPNHQTDNGETPLHLGRLNALIVELLLANGAE